MTKLDIDEKAFKTAYIANFLASYMAVNFDNNCLNGWSGRQYNNQPIEDAVHMADCAWKTLTEKISGE